MADDHEILVSAKKYNQLVKDAEILSALYAGGVDNWEWYLESLREADLYPNVVSWTGAKKMSEEYTNDDPSLIGTGAIKYDGGKPAVFQGLINYFPRALWAVADISTFGAKKYAWNGWEGVENGFARYKDAQYRHALKKAMGEDIDPDSELEHLAHEAWGALATLELYLREKTKCSPS